jgi:hypothetical protein
MLPFDCRSGSAWSSPANESFGPDYDVVAYRLDIDDDEDDEDDDPDDMDDVDRDDDDDEDDDDDLDDEEEEEWQVSGSDTSA